MSGRMEQEGRGNKNVKSRLGQRGGLFVRQWERKGIVLDESLARTIGGANPDNNALRAGTILRSKRAKKFPIMAEII